MKKTAPKEIPSKAAEIEFLDKQFEAFNYWQSPDITELGYGGAAGGGKTRLGWYLIILLCKTYIGARCVVGRKELKTLRMTTLAELWIIFNEMKMRKGIDYTFNATDNVLRFENGSEVMLLDTAYSPEDPEYTRFGSLPVTFAWIDESNETPDKAKAILKTRVGRANMLYKRVLGKDGKPTRSEEKFNVKGFWLETFNPNKGHVYRDYYKPWKAGTMPSYRKFIRALPGDNPTLPPQYIENLKRSDKVTRERLLKGNFEFDDDPQKMMDYDAITDLPFNALQPTTKILANNDVVPDTIKDNTKYLINDIARFGGDKIVSGVFKGRLLYRLAVNTYQGIDESVRIAKQLCQEEGIPAKNVLSDEDGVGGGFVDLFKGTKGFHGNAAPTMIWDHMKQKFIPENYKNMRSQCYYMLSEGVNNRLWRIAIEKFETNIEGYTLEQCLADLFEELDAVKKTDDSNGGKLGVIPKDEMKEALGRSPDFADILMMRQLFELKDEPMGETFYHANNSRKGEIKNRAI